MDYEERITAAELGQGEERSEMTLRPQKLEDYIGQEKAKETVKFVSAYSSTDMWGLEAPRCSGR